ncbi:DUF2946 family protein [Hydrogenophilus thermoluteolus]|uniref:DUF2946 domain-containing protein n=1 Tax=Hydrogenophilus thermoluteolus TaxID=297 RepID=A0A2Z6E087_HYDTE|nr:DUF2946 family protein [Hydrogenophilus thermoluteolus]BBD78197.1 hypothetical protein HPTL_1943 [Hydrogenophilus thermoluteolus]
MNRRNAALLVALWWCLTAFFPLVSWEVRAQRSFSDVCSLVSDAADAAAGKAPSQAPPAAHDHHDPFAACGYCLLATTHPGIASPWAAPWGWVVTVAALPVAFASVFADAIAHRLPPVRAPPR